MNITISMFMLLLWILTGIVINTLYFVNVVYHYSVKNYPTLYRGVSSFKEYLLRDNMIFYIVQCLLSAMMGPITLVVIWFAYLYVHND